MCYMYICVCVVLYVLSVRGSGADVVYQTQGGKKV
jgi:hypothetical protein